MMFETSEENNLITHAKRELRFAGYSPNDTDPMNVQIYNSTLDIVRAFIKCGHSGMSAQFHVAMIQSLLSFEALGPVTDNPDEWLDVSDAMGGDPTWQNIRDSKMFSEDGGKTYYNLNEYRYGWRRKLLGRKGKKHRSVPYAQPAVSDV